MRHKVESITSAASGVRTHHVMYTYPHPHPFRTGTKDVMRPGQGRGYNNSGYNSPMNPNMNFMGGGFRGGGGRGGFNNRGGGMNNNNTMGGGGFRNNSFGGGGFQGNPMAGGFQPAAGSMGAVPNYAAFNNRGGNMMMGGMRGGGGMRGRGVGSPTMGTPGMMGMPTMSPMTSMTMSPMAGGMNPMMGMMPGRSIVLYCPF